jgi:hypothetical protein
VLVNFGGVKKNLRRRGTKMCMEPEYLTRGSGGKPTVLRSYRTLGLEPHTKDYGGAPRPSDGLRKNMTECHHFLRRRKPRIARNNVKGKP